MGSIVSFFVGGPARIQALLIGALAVAVVCMGLLVYGLYWRGEAKAAEGKVIAAVAQGTVLADAVKTCSAGVDAAAKVGAAALDVGAQLLEAERKRTAKDAGLAKSIGDLAARKSAPGEDCRTAWREIEEELKKARAAP